MDGLLPIKPQGSFLIAVGRLGRNGARERATIALERAKCAEKADKTIEPDQDRPSDGHHAMDAG